MTIFYVDPVAGSNSNSGQGSWANAWKWLPGNGTTINPGDEIRIAKSAESLTDSGKLLRMSGDMYNILPNTSMTGCAILYGETGLSNSWTSLHGSVTSGSILTISGGASIAANTPLAYVTLNGNPFNITAGHALELLVAVTGIPTGAKLKFVLYSDLGITPIATLYGPNALSSTATNPTGLSQYAQYLYEPGGTLNLSIRQVRVFSDEAFTVESYGARIVQIGTYFRTYETTGTFKMWKFGQACEHTTYDPAAVSYLPSMPSPVPGATFIREYNSSPTQFFANDHIKSGGTTITGTHSLQPKGYAPLPFDPTLYETPLTFSGTSGNRITISGGWNTSSGVQDGYSNLCIAGVGVCKRKAPFVFSSGGDYLTFRRILVHDAHVVYYTYAVGTLNELRLYNCAWGRMPNNSYAPSGLIGLSYGSNSSLTIGTLLLDTCRASNALMVSRCHAGETELPTGSWCPEAGNMVFGNVDIIDSIIVHFYTNNLPYYTAIKYTGYFRMYSSVAGSVTSRFGIKGYGRDNEFITGPTAQPMKFTDVLLDASQNAGIGQYGKETVATTLEVELLRVAVSGNNRSTEQKNFLVQFVKKVTVDTFTMGANNGTDTAVFTLRWSKGWLALNPTGQQIVFNGSHEVLGGMNQSYSAFKIDYLVGDLSVGANFELPLCINTWKNGARVYNSTIESLQLLWSYSEYASSPEGYGPYAPILDIENVVAFVQVLNSVPVGSVRRFGGEQTASSTYKNGLGGQSTPQRALLNYGTLLANLSVYTPSQISSPLGCISRSRSVDVDVTSLVTLVVNSATANPYLDSQDIIVKDSVVLPCAQTMTDMVGFTEVSSNNYGMSLRKLNGEFLHVSGRCAAYNIPTANQYGFWPLRISRSLHLATLDVQANVSVVLKIRYISVSAQNNYIVLSVPPCEAYTTTLEGHQFRKNIRASGQEYLLETTITPQRDGVIDVHIYAFKEIEVRMFSADAV